MRVFLKFFLFTAALMILVSCQVGQAEFSMDFKNVAFDPSGTVFAYVDASNASGAPRATPRVVLVMTWLSFDPTKELGHVVSQDYLHAMQDEFLKRELLILVFDDKKDVVPNKPLKATIENGKSNAFHAMIRTGPGSDPIASRRIVKIRLDEALDKIEGKIEIEIGATAADQGKGMVSGFIQGEFKAPWVDEAVAKSNLAALGQGSDELKKLLDY